MKPVFQNIRNAVLFILSFFLFSSSFSQIYPVQLSTQLLPPYSSYLPDYGDPTNEKLKCILVLQDFSVTHRDVKLHITITGNGFSIQTKSSFIPSPVTLTPGIPVLITASDLAPYLETQNLNFTGINPADYELRKILPEGHYSICIKAYDYYNSSLTQLSNESCNYAWFFLNDPPFLNFPLCDEEITSVTPQNIIFQWTAMNLNSPNSAFNTEYDFELFELRPNNGIPNNIVQNSAPVYSVTTTQPFLQYGITEPTLYAGMKYVWRVRARDLSGRDLFKNEGWSQICTFTYGNINSLFPEDAFTLTLQATASTHRQGKVWWNHIANFSQYHVQVRKAGTQNWFDYYSATAELKINELEPSTAYETRVMGTGNNIESAWSNTAVFTTPAKPQFNCNDQTQPVNALGANPLLQAYSGMHLQIGQFEIVTITISPDAGAPGFYSGYGKVSMYMITVGVKYDHVYINDNHEITSGNVVALSDGIDDFVENWMINQETENYIEGTVDSIIVNEDSTITVITTDGDTLNFDFPGMGHPIIINDESGAQYTIWPDGTIEEGTWITYSEDYLDCTEENKVIFLPAEEQVYGLDNYEVMVWAEHYETIKLTDETNYFTANKSIKTGGNDYVMAAFANPELQMENFIFETASGELLQADFINGKAKIHLQNLQEDASIYAVFEEKRFGKLNVKVYEEEEKEVVIVPFAGTQTGDVTNIRNALAKTYGEAVYKWNLSLAAEISIPDWDLNGNGKVDIDDYSLLNKYSDEMDKIRNGFSDEGTDKNAYILFVVPGFGDATVDGYMPYGRRYGFIKSGANAKTYAHELGHGAFGLQHTFPQAEQGSTDNLLDYGTGIHLASWQWDWMREGHWLENLNSNQEMILYSSADEASPWLELKTHLGDFSDYAFPFINGRFMKIKNAKKINFNRYGQVLSFILENGNIYRSLRTESRLLGYVSDEDYHELVNKIITAEFVAVYKEKLIGITYFESCNPEDSILSYARRIEGETYIDCYCINKWKANISSQVIDTGYWDSQFRIPAEHEKVYCNGGDACDINLEEEGVISGVGVKFYISVYREFPQGSTKRQKLANLANYFSEKIGNKRFAFYGNGFEEDIFGDVFSENTITLLKERDILDIETFHDNFPYSTDYSSDFQIIFSTTELRDDIPLGYNSASHDWSKSSEGNNVKYEYSFADLKKREVVKTIPALWKVVENLEQQGDAKPINQQDFYQQYVSKYKTNSALFFISEWSARWAKDPLVAYTFYRASFMAPASISTQLTYTFLKQAAIGGMVDYLMQIGLIYYFSEDDISFAEVREQVDYYEVAVAAFTSVFSSPDKINLLIQAGAECLYNGFTEGGELTDGFSYSDCARGVITAILVQKLTHGVLNTIKNFPIERVYKGLKKIGTFTKEQIKDILEWFGFGADDIARVVGNTIDSVFGRSVINSINGFSDNIANLVSEYGISIDQFKTLQKKTYSELSDVERNIILNIRNSIPSPNSSTIMQKVIPKSDIIKYLNGERTSCRGFMTTAKDAKHLNSYSKIYNGMRLDYEGSAFGLSDGSCGAIRFKASNSSTASVPINLSSPDPFPFTNHGFTSGKEGLLGVPEWKMNNFADLDNGSAELWEIFEDGTEVLKAVYDINLHKFVPIN